MAMFTLRFMLCLIVLFAASSGRADVTFHQRFIPFLKKYCVDCHKPGRAKADVDVTIFGTPASLEEHREDLELVLEMLDFRAMPPEKKTQPSESELDQIIKGIRGTLSNVDCSSGKRYPGQVTIRRLNRNEYNNTIRDLLDIDFKPAERPSSWK